MSDDSKQAWGDFWAAQQGRSGGCLPDGYRGIEAAQKAAWGTLAKDLPDEARVLDLATGDGRVMEWLLESAPSLNPVGVDLAPKLPHAPAGTTVHAGVAMEALPFADDTFDVVVSQFGFEYGDVEQVSAEAARVLKPAGQLAILTHRIDGPILAHNAARRMQIGWIFDRKNLFNKAHAALEIGASGPSIEVDQAVQEGAQRFGPRSAAWEIAEAIRRAMLMRAQAPLRQVLDTLKAIEGHARNEIGRINSLEEACRTTEDSTVFDQNICAAGFQVMSSKSIAEDGPQSPFADFRRYCRDS